MSAQEPGFGAVESLKDPMLFTVLFFLGGVGTAVSGSLGWSIGLSLVGCLLLFATIVTWREQQQEASELQTRPPTSQAELTRRVCAWTHATPNDLAMNRQGILSLDQQQYIENLPKYKRFKLDHISPIYSVYGTVSLRHRKPAKAPAYYELAIQGVSFIDSERGLVDAFKRTASYRLYIVELTYINWGAICPPIRFLLSGEAVGDA